MGKKSKLTQVAVKIGTAMGKADRTAHKIAKAGLAAKDELEAIADQIDVHRKWHEYVELFGTKGIPNPSLQCGGACLLSNR